MTLTAAKNAPRLEGMTIQPLMDDYCPKGKLRGEHGLAYLIEDGASKVLFDTGQTDAFLHNAAVAGADLSRLDAVVLSHGHYDHCGGLAALYSAIAPASPKLYAGKGFSRQKYARSDDGLSDIGVPAAALSAPVPSAVEVESTLELHAGMFIVPRAERKDGSSSPPRFRLLAGGVELPDEFDDEVSLVVDSKDGLVVVTGCAHRGILNIAEAAMWAFPGRPLAALVGGFHLADAPDETLSKVAEGIAALAPGRVLCGHCTGTRGFAAIASHVRQTAWLACGMRVEL